MCIDGDSRRRQTDRHARKESERGTHHLTELDGRVAHFIPDPDRDLYIPTIKRDDGQLVRLVQKSQRKGINHANATIKRATNQEVRACVRV
jgi:hypothetical protein